MPSLLTLTANMQSTAGVAAAGSALQITLAGYGSSTPMVAGTTMLASVRQKVAFTNGALSIPLYGNDVISPAGTFYAIQVLGPKGNVIGTTNYQLTGTGGVDLSVLTPYDPTNVQGLIFLINASNPGPTAYQVAVANGFVGTPAQWLVSLTGPMGQVSGPGMATAISKSNPVNLLVPGTVAFQVQIQTANGALYGISDGRFYATDFFVAPPGGTLISNAATITSAGYPPFGYAFYDYNLNYISGASAPVGTVVSVPASCTYARFSAATGGGEPPLSQVVILANTAVLPTAYVFPGLSAVASDAIRASGAAGASGSMTYGPITNLFDPAALTYEAQVETDNGGIYGIADGRFYATGYLRVPAGGTLISNAGTISASGYPNFGYAFYDSALNYISGASAANGTVVAVPAAAMFARFSAATTPGEPPVASVMLLPNTPVVPTTYIYPGLSITPSQALDKSSVLANASLPAYGKKWYHVGDSISAIYGGNWLPAIVANTGIVQVGQDAHTGRPTQAIFEYYGLNAPGGTYTGPGDPVNGYAEDPTAQGVQNVWADGISRWVIGGKTLPQVLAAAAPDLITIYMGTNDTVISRDSPGTITDPTTANTQYGYTKRAIEGYLDAAPAGCRLLWILPYKNANMILDATNQSRQVCCEIIQQVCDLYGVPTLDLDRTSGVNSTNFATYLIDGLHPTAYGDAMLARRFSSFINGMF